MTTLELPIPRKYVGRDGLTTREVVAIVDGRLRLSVDRDSTYRERIRAGADVVRRRVESGESLYGVTTGFGDSCQTNVPLEQVAELQANLVRYHGCGTGKPLDERSTAAVLAVRLASLARGYSGVRPELLDRLASLLELGILPRIPEQGSVGASGDLTPLSYIAAALVGEREVSWRSQTIPAREALQRAGLGEFRLAPKEGLAIMNGTSVMTGIGCIVWDRGRKLARFANAVTAMAIDVLRGNRHHFDPRIDALKPHPGQRTSAGWIRDDIEFDPVRPDDRQRLQDRYSIRCAPHVIGVLLDGLDVVERVLDVEINSVNDNPLVDPDIGDFINGGNFYGGHIAYALDALKPALANVAGLLDRQLALLCSESTSNGLPANLVPTRPGGAAHHGFKAMQITASAVTAEALKLTMPASVFSRSTECHNQDVVSMGMHSARDCLQVLDLCETVAAICILATCQAVDLRAREGCHRRSLAVHEAVRRMVPPVVDDRPQDRDIVAVLELFRANALPIGDVT